MALVNPNIAMSFRQPEFRPRNALAEYAQVQQIMGGQRQAEMADMQMEALRRKERAISQIQAAAVKHGGPADRREIAQAYIKSGVPEFMQIGLTMDKDLDELEAFDRIMGGGAAAPVPRAAAPGAAPSAVAAAPASEGELVAEPLRPIPSPVTAPAAADAPAPAGETDRAYLQRQFGTPGGAAAGPNALAPAAAPTTNAMLASAQPAAAPAGVAQTDRVAELRARRDQLLALGTPRALQAAKSLDTDIALMSKANTLSDRFVPVGNLVFDRQTEKFISPTEAQRQQQQPQDPIIRQYEYAKQQGFTGSLFDFKRQLTEAGRPPAQPRAEPAPRTKEVTLNDGTLGIMNMDTGAITRATVSGVPAKGKPSAFAEKTAAQRVQLEKDLTTAISELKDAAKPGGLIDQSTGSGAGRLVDVGARFVGKATPGDIAIGKLAPIADLVLKMVPRFEGPQSDKDTKSYKEAAGQLADATLPREIRKQAANTIVRLMENRKGQFVSKDMAAEGAGAASVPAPPPGFTPDKQ